MSPERPTPRAVVFDFDGVVIESGAIKTAAFAELFAEHPEHREAIVRHHLEHLGLSRYAKFEWIYSELLDRPLPAAERDRLDRGFRRLVLERAVACPEVPGAESLLAALAERTVPAFVVSGTPQGELGEIVRRRGLESFFVEVRGTPPEKAVHLRSLIDRHRLDREHTVMIGDGLSDLEAAAEVGIGFLARDAPDDGATAWPPGTPTVPDLSAAARHLGFTA